MEHVLITVVTPLKRKESNGALTVEKVVEDRLLYDKNRWGSQTADGLTVKSISKEFTFGESKRELHRCRLRACLYQDKTDDFKVSEAYTETINDTRDKVCSLVQYRNFCCGISIFIFQFLKPFFVSAVFLHSKFPINLVTFRPKSV